MSWHELGEWWNRELASDPAYEEDVAPLVISLLEPRPGARYLDVGCGEGRMMSRLRAMGADVVGVDIAQILLRRARVHGPVFRSELPELSCLADGSVEGSYVSLVLEHIKDHRALFCALARVTVPTGTLAVVMNHPLFTAPDSAPIQEPDEVLWRPGAYFCAGHSDEPAGAATVRFHHRPMGALLTDASDTGWDLRRMVEIGVTPGQIERLPTLDHQRHIPRLLGVRWSRRPPGAV